MLLKNKPIFLIISEQFSHYPEVLKSEIIRKQIVRKEQEI